MSPTAAPKLRRLRFHVWMAPEGIDPDSCPDEEAELTTVLIAHQDQLKAELMASQQAVDMKRQPMAITSLWLYAAMARQELTTDKYPVWKRRLLAYDPVDSPAAMDQLDDDDDHEADANPTEASTSTD